MPSRRRRLDVARQPVERDPHDSRHRGDLGGRRAAFDDENRPDQVIDREAMLGDQPPGPGVVAVAPHTGRGKAADRHAGFSWAA